jgi:hypothetical protein
MKQYFKFLYSFSFFCLLLSLSSCLESDKFDGLTDTKPAIALTFPGRQYVQEGGLVFVTTGYANNPDVNVVMELEGGEGRTIASIKQVEVRAARIGGSTCTYRVFETNVSAANSRSFTYTKPLSILQESNVTCNASVRQPNVYYEFIFTVILDNGQEIVSMPVRSLIQA